MAETHSATPTIEPHSDKVACPSPAEQADVFEVKMALTQFRIPKVYSGHYSNKFTRITIVWPEKVPFSASCASGLSSGRISILLDAHDYEATGKPAVIYPSAYDDLSNRKYWHEPTMHEQLGLLGYMNKTNRNTVFYTPMDSSIRNPDNTNIVLNNRHHLVHSVSYQIHSFVYKGILIAIIFHNIQLAEWHSIYKFSLELLSKFEQQAFPQTDSIGE